MPTNYFSSYDGMKVMAEVDSEGRNVAGSINTINGLIPASARPDNKLVSRSELADELGEFGYSVADGDPTTGEPVVAGDKSPHMVYLVKDDDAPGDDKYFEWIWAAQDTDPVTYAWEKIGETSFELDIDTETFRTGILIDQNTPLLVDDDTPMVENDDVTLVKAVNGDEIIARRAREDVNGESLELRVENGKVSGIGGKDLVQPGLATVATTGNYNDLSDKPNLTVYAETEDLADVAFSGSYNDLVDKPPIPAAQVQSDWAQTDSTSANYINNKPGIVVLTGEEYFDDFAYTEQNYNANIKGKEVVYVMGGSNNRIYKLSVISDYGSYLGFSATFCESGRQENYYFQWNRNSGQTKGGQLKNNIGQNYNMFQIENPDGNNKKFLVYQPSQVNPKTCVWQSFPGDGFVGYKSERFTNVTTGYEGGGNDLLLLHKLLINDVGNGEKKFLALERNANGSFTGANAYALATVATSGSYDDLVTKAPVFAGSTSGLVPAATAGDAAKALRGDGTWGDVSNVSVSYDAVNEELHLDFSNGGN